MFADQTDSELVVSRSQIFLNGTAIPTDLLCLERSLIQANYNKEAEQFMVIGGGSLLDQLNFGEAFEQWSDNHRVQTEQRLKNAVILGLAAVDKRKSITEYNHLLDAGKLRAHDLKTITTLGLEEPQNKIAVLAFTSLEEQNYFADGVVDEIITMLGQVPTLLIAGRRSSFVLKDSKRSSSEIVQILSVAHLVEGAVQV
jgi:hypothetical protein